MADTKEKKSLEAAGVSREPIPDAHDHLATDEVVFVGEDGFKLFPQPVREDQLDPLNWSFAQKHVILAIVMALYA